MPNPDAGPPATRNPQLATRNSLLQLSVISPSGTLFAGPVDSVVFPAWDGLMGVLPGHAPLLALLRPGTVSARPASSSLTHTRPLSFGVTGGFADVGPTHVRLIADSATQA
jgi:F-type H+-transporting ATPase subunit epsilon